MGRGIRDSFSMTVGRDQMKETFQNIFQQFSSPLKSHGINVANYSERLLFLILDETGEPGLEELNRDERLYVGALFHDIGKLKTPITILNKPSGLTVEEMSVMKDHATCGKLLIAEQFDIADQTYKNELMKIVCYHHERWDGKGYPYGLKGNQIPASARICSIADSYDAMVGGRIYQKQITHQMACDEIRKNAGTQFDPVIAEVFVRNHDLFMNERE